MKKVLIILILLILLAVGYLVASGKSLQDLLSGAGGLLGDKIGQVSKVDGTLKREPKNTVEFKDTKTGAQVFDEDTVMTGGDDSASIHLDDGGQIDLGPNSLVRLSFQSNFNLNGVQRQPVISVISGSVSGQAENKPILLKSASTGAVIPIAAHTRQIVMVDESSRGLKTAPALPQAHKAPEVITKPSSLPLPSPSPSPTPSPSPLESPLVLQITSPHSGATLAIPRNTIPPLRTDFRFTSSKGQNGQLAWALTGDSGAKVGSGRTELKKGQGKIELMIAHPGKYKFSLQELALPPTPGAAPQGAAHTLGQTSIEFKVAPEFIGIQMFSPLVGGENIDSNRYIPKKMGSFDLTLSWKAFPGVEKYHVTAKDAAGEKVADDDVAETRFDLKRDKVLSGSVAYEVTGITSNGFIVHSEMKRFGFQFSSPMLTEPANGSSERADQDQHDGEKGIFFTWQKTLYTDSYTFELAADPEFSNILKTTSRTENYVTFKSLHPGTYYWRVIAVAGTMQSPPGKPSKLIVTP